MFCGVALHKQSENNDKEKEKNEGRVGKAKEKGERREREGREKEVGKKEKRKEKRKIWEVREEEKDRLTSFGQCCCRLQYSTGDGLRHRLSSCRRGNGENQTLPGVVRRLR